MLLHSTIRRGLLVLLGAATLSACQDTDDGAPLGTSTSQADDDDDDDDDDNSSASSSMQEADFTGAAGGRTTINLADAMAFAMPSPTLSGTSLQNHINGRNSFEQVWTLEQLAPLWNNEKCSGCHVNGGRSPLRATPQLLFRVSIPGTNPDGGPRPVPGIGDQIQPFINNNGTRAVGVEGTVSTSYVEELRAFVDGQTYSLRTPTYRPSATLPADVMISPRIGGQVAGLGLLEEVSESSILSVADANDRDGDGISGRPNYVWSVAAQRTVLGRFGWKANQPNLLQQAAAAYNGDLGLTSPFFPLESNVEGGGRNMHGEDDDDEDDHDAMSSRLPTDITIRELNNTTLYTKTLAVPAARNSSSEQVLAGRALFVAAKCAACHRPALKTREGAGYGLANQTIHAYTDLLLHDMGPGLADNRPDFQASGREWRTAPLWGLGLSATTSNHTNYLHDGRARNVVEAIMWHGGEGDASRRYVEKLSQADRNALVAFVNSL